MKTCEACKGTVAGHAVFCPKCGFRLDPMPEGEHERLSDEQRAKGEHCPVEPGRAEDAEERRQAERFPLQVEVDYQSEHNFYTGFLANISSGGLFIATERHAEIGEEFEVTFTVPGLQRTCVAMCQVRWVREVDSPDAPAGIGCRFCRIDPEARAAIDLFIRHREPIFFD